MTGDEKGEESAFSWGRREGREEFKMAQTFMYLSTVF